MRLVCWLIVVGLSQTIGLTQSIPAEIWIDQMTWSGYVGDEFGPRVRISYSLGGSDIPLVSPCYKLGSAASGTVNPNIIRQISVNAASPSFRLTITTHEERKQGSDDCTAQGISDVSFLKPDRFEVTSSKDINLTSLPAGVYVQGETFVHSSGGSMFYVYYKIRYTPLAPARPLVSETSLCGGESCNVSASYPPGFNNTGIEYIWEYWLNNDFGCRENCLVEESHCCGQLIDEGGGVFICTQTCTTCLQSETICDIPNWQILTTTTQPNITFTSDDRFYAHLTRDDTVANAITFRVRVKGPQLVGNASPLSNRVDLFVRPPTITITPREPNCHNGDGEIEITATAAIPTLVSNFVGKLTSDNPPVVGEEPFDNSHVFRALKAFTANDPEKRSFFISVRNNTNTEVFGSCEVTSGPIILHNPTEIQVNLSSATRNEFNIRCHEGSDGEITATAFGGAGGFKDFSWDRSPSTSAVARGLQKGRHIVTLKDANDCPASASTTLTQPNAAVSVAVTSNEPVPGFQVSCANKPDGNVTAVGSGGVGGFTYQWSGGPASPTYTNLGVGTYEVTVKDANGCPATASVTLVAKPNPEFSITKIENICANEQEGSLAVDLLSLQNVQGSAQYLWSHQDRTVPSINNLGAGSYEVTVTDSRGPLCATRKSETLVDPPAYSVNIEATSSYNEAAISCNNGTDGALASIVRDQNNLVTTGALYQWFKNNEPTSFATTPSVEGLAKGNYRVEVAYGNSNRCKTENTFILTDPQPLVPAIAVTSNYNGLPISCTGLANASLAASASGGIGPYSYRWLHNNSVSQASAGLSAGVYAVVATDANGCSASTTRTISDPDPVVPSIQVVSNFSGFAIRCAGESNAQLRANASGGTGLALGYSYAWSTGSTGADLTNRPTGVYTVTATDQNGCTGVASQTITEPTPTRVAIQVISNFNGQAIKCHGESNASLQAVAEGGAADFSYLWSTSAVAPVVVGLGQGTYSVTARDKNGCSTTSTRIISQPPPVSVQIAQASNFNGFGVSCFQATDGFLLARATGGTPTNVYRFEWLNNSERSARLSNIGAGTYTVLARDTNNCLATVARTITQPSRVAISVVAQKNIACHGDPSGEIRVNASGGVPTYTYSRDGNSWQPVSEFRSLSAQAYTLRVRDANQCTASVGTTLSEPEPIQITFTDIEPAYCSDPRGKARALARGGVAAYRYSWRDTSQVEFDTDATIERRPPGVYGLTLTDANGCVAESSVGIVSADGPSVSVTASVPPSCSYSSDGSITVEAFGNGPFVYTWPNNQNTSRLTNVSQGTYIVTVRDKNDCVTTRAAELIAPAELTVELKEFLQPACYGQANGSLTVEASGGTRDYSYNWGTTVGATFAGLSKGTYTVVVTDKNSCVTEKRFELREPDSLQLQLVERTLPRCFGGCDGSLKVSAAGGNGGFAWAWASGSKQELAAGLCAGAHSVTLTDNRGCTLERTFLLGQPEQLRVRQLTNRAPDCHDGCNGQLEVDAIGGTGGAQWVWNTGVTTPSLSNLCAGNYTVTATDTQGCTAQSNYTIINPEELLVDLGEGVTLCVGQTHILDAGNQWTEFAWSSNTGFTSNQQRVVIKDPGRYSVNVRNALGCTASDEFLLETSRDLLKASFLIPAEAMIADTVVMIDISWPLPETISWRFPAEMKKLIDLRDVVFGQFTKEGTYTVTLAAALGECRDVLGKEIRILAAKNDPTSGRLGYREWVKAFEIYPNPSNGNFEVLVELAEKGNVTLSVWNPVTGRMITRNNLSDNLRYQSWFDIREMGAGTYVLRLDHSLGTRYIRFIVY
jgi:hypothetical protein